MQRGADEMGRLKEQYPACMGLILDNPTSPADPAPPPDVNHATRKAQWAEESGKLKKGKKSQNPSVLPVMLGGLNPNSLVDALINGRGHFGPDGALNTGLSQLLWNGSLSDLGPGGYEGIPFVEGDEEATRHGGKHATTGGTREPVFIDENARKAAELEAASNAQELLEEEDARQAAEQKKAQKRKEKKKRQ